jgi:paraquat-inducible protein A
MVVAVLIMTVKLGAVASIQIHAGLYIFAIAVLLIMFLTQQVVKHIDKITLS